jgi:AcrR family transcriptional regulator
VVLFGRSCYIPAALMIAEKNEIGDGRVRRGERTRRQILDLAVDLASVEGLEGLSIGGLASTLAMSKSGLFASFGSKEELQLATIEHARQIFIDAVVRKAMMAPRGLPRLWALCDSWLEYAGRKVFRGGCFFAAAAAEFDSHPGPIRDRLAALMKEWLTTVAVAVRKAQEAGHLRSDADPAQLAFEIHSLFLGANWAFQLHGDSGAFDRARAAIRQRLAALTPTKVSGGRDGSRRRRT